MPWINRENNDIVNQAKEIIYKEFNIKIQCEIFTCTRNELISKCIEELKVFITNDDLLKREITYLNFIYGKYFVKSNEIWVVDKEGEEIDVILHEMLHSIQICEINREGIVDFLTFIFTRNSVWIDSNSLQNWIEIEKMMGIGKIKSRILIKGDCEEF